MSQTQQRRQLRASIADAVRPFFCLWLPRSLQLYSLLINQRFGLHFYAAIFLCFTHSFRPSPLLCIPRRKIRKQKYNSFDLGRSLICVSRGLGADHRPQLNSISFDFVFFIIYLSLETCDGVWVCVERKRIEFHIFSASNETSNSRDCETGSCVLALPCWCAFDVNVIEFRGVHHSISHVCWHDSRPAASAAPIQLFLPREQEASQSIAAAPKTRTRFAFTILPRCFQIHF